MVHWLLLTVIILVVVAGTVGHAVLLPFQRCPRCRDRVAGSGWLSSSKAYNLRCRKCGGTGRVVRPTSRLLNKGLGVPLRGKEK